MSSLQYIYTAQLIPAFDKIVEWCCAHSEVLLALLLVGLVTLCSHLLIPLSDFHFQLFLLLTACALIPLIGMYGSAAYGIIMYLKGTDD